MKGIASNGLVISGREGEDMVGTYCMSCHPCKQNGVNSVNETGVMEVVTTNRVVGGVETAEDKPGVAGGVITHPNRECKQNRGDGGCCHKQSNWGC